MDTGLGGILTIIFVVLKLTHNIDWPWLWVLSPLWIGLVIDLALLTLVVLLGGSFALLGARNNRTRVRR